MNGIIKVENFWNCYNGSEFATKEQPWERRVHIANISSFIPTREAPAAASAANPLLFFR